MNLTKWIESLYKPQQTNLRDAAIEDINLALNEPAVRNHWIDAMVEELRAINIGVDRALADNNFEQLPSKAERRRAILFCLNQILDSKQSLDTERFEETHDNQNQRSQFDGVAVQPT